MKSRTFLLAVLLSGCSSAPYWVEEHPPLYKEVIHLVDRSPWGSEHGWIKRAGDVCHIFIVRLTAADYDCVLAHERRHCAGFGHPDYPVSFACTPAFDLLRVGGR